MREAEVRSQKPGVRMGMVAILAALAACGFTFQARKSRVEIREHLVHPANTLHLVARHCQKYLRDGVLDQAACAGDPTTVFAERWTRNLRVNAGVNWQSDLMADTTTPPVNAQCNYIALTNTAITPAAGDTTLSGEITTNGLARAQGTYTHTSNATSYTLTHTFTATAAQAAQGEGVFTASSSGTMCFEDTFTQASLQTNDTLAITHTVNF
jgi:hypothetical protein